MAGERPPEDPDRIPTGVELTALDATFRTTPGFARSSTRRSPHVRSRRLAPRIRRIIGELLDAVAEGEGSILSRRSPGRCR
jgi:hypothetical protein